MDMLKKLSPATQVLLGGVVLYVIFSFFDWQQVCVDIANVCGGVSEWHGFGGTITALCAIVLLVWEGMRLFNVQINLGGISHGLISLGLALLLLLLTIITFLSHNEARHWPAWIGLILSIVIAGAAVMRGKEEGVEVGDFRTLASSMGSSGGAASTTTAPPSAPVSPPPAADPAPPAPPAADPPTAEDATPPAGGTTQT